MEPLAIAGYLLVANAALSGVLAGSIGGAIAWALQRSFAWTALGAIVAYLAAVFFFADFSLKAAAVFGLPAMVMTFVAAWLLAWLLETRIRLQRIWTLPLAICGSLAAGLVWGLLFTLDIWAPTAFAVPADLLLIVLLYMVMRARTPS